MVLGTMLREWRTVRRRSQLEVAMDAGLSQRQFSFIESGRSAPKRETVLAIAGALEIPLRERNALLVASGFAPMYSEAAWSEPEMQSIKAAVDRMLRAQEPYPALLMDRYWNVLSDNHATWRFFGKFVDMEARAAQHVARGTPRNLLHLMFDPNGMQPFIHDWPRVSQSLLHRVRREAVGHTIDARSQDLLDALLAYPGARVDAPASLDGTSDLPMIPLGFEKDGAVLNYFSMVSTVGTPQTVAAQELRVECLFPADEATEARHLALVDGAG
jgi:transcriptional regulator with XRE-family HTH domain